MALPQIETGYKPEFGLGALYQGYNAANADQMAQEDLIKAFLANQRETQMQPLDIGVRQWDAASAQDKLNDPLFRQMILKGQIGRDQADVARGQVASGTVNSEIDAKNSGNIFSSMRDRAKTVQEKELLRQLEILASGGDVVPSSPTFGQQEATPSNINQPSSVEGRIASNWGGEANRPTNADIVMPVPGNLNRENLLKPTMGNDYGGATPYDIPELKRELARKNLSPQVRTELIAELERALSISNSGQKWTPVNQDVTPTGIAAPQPAPMPTQQVQSIDRPVNLLERMSKLRMMNPEHMGKMEEIAAQTSGRESVATIAAEARIEAARKAAENGDTVKAKDLQHSAKLLSDALGYEKLINGQDIQAQKDALLMKIAGGDSRAKGELSSLNANVERWKQLATASRAKAQQIDKKYGYDSPSDSSPVAPTTTQPKVIKLD